MSNITNSNPQIASIYALLGRIFISELDRQSLEALKQQEVSSILEKLHSGVQDYLSDTQWDNEQVEQLASDYCHLFILPKKPGLSLRASHWMTSEEANNLNQLEVIISGLDIETSASNAGFSNVPHDHVGVLLYFISSVYASEDVQIQKLAGSIVQLALFPWIFRFIEQLLLGSKNPIYLSSGKLLQELLEFEMVSSGSVASKASAD